MLRIRQRRTAGIGTIAILVVIVIIAVGAIVLVAAASNPERAQNSCAKPVAWTKAEGAFHVDGLLGGLTGSITRAEVRVQATEYDSSGGFHLLGFSLFGNKGSAWVRSYATGPSGEISETRDSDKVAYDFGLITGQSGSVDGTFRTGEVCVSSHGAVNWHFELIAKGDASDSKEFRLDVETRTVNA